MNIEFQYMYRDGANYKQYHSEVFSNKKGLSVDEIDYVIKSALIEGGWFYANKWKLKDLHYYKWDEEIDHNWHEYICVEITQEQSANRDIYDFIELIKSQVIQ